MPNQPVTPQTQPDSVTKTFLRNFFGAVGAGFGTVFVVVVVAAMLYFVSTTNPHLYDEFMKVLPAAKSMTTI